MNKVLGTLTVIIIFTIGVLFNGIVQTNTRASAQNINKPFPIKYVGTLEFEKSSRSKNTNEQAISDKLNVGVSDTSLSQSAEEIVISGKDKQQKNWSVTLGVSPLYPVQFYESDLDKNSIKDLILLIPTGGNGLAPINQLFTLTFDSNGRPVPFSADGYFTEGKDGKIIDLVDMDKDGRAELLHSNHHKDVWITTFYKIQNARWQKKDGKFAGQTYPIYSKQGDDREISSKKSKAFTIDLSNTKARFGGKLISYKWADIYQSEDITLKIRRSNGKVISAKPVSWSANFLIVIDNESGRKIVSLSADEKHIKSALDEIIKNKHKVEIYGQRLKQQNSPELLWAKL